MKRMFLVELSIQSDAGVHLASELVSALNWLDACDRARQAYGAEWAPWVTVTRVEPMAKVGRIVSPTDGCGYDPAAPLAIDAPVFLGVDPAGPA